MNGAFRIFACCLLFPTLLTAQRIFTPEEVREDMKFLKNRFEQMHPGMYYYTQAAAYDSVYQQLYNNVPENMLYQEVFQYISPLVTMVRDGHTSYKFDKKQYSKNPKLFPFSIQAFGGEYYVSYNGSSDTLLVRGTKLLRINDEPMPQIISKLQSIYGTDDGNSSSRDYYSSRFFNIFYYKYYGPSDSLKITYKLRDSVNIQTQFVQNITRENLSKIILKRNKNASRKNFDYAIIDSTAKVAKLDITSFSYKANFLDVAQLKFKKMLKRRFRQMEADSVKHLIVDFRGNGGGFIPNITRTMAYFAKEPFELLDTIYFKKTAFKKVAPYYTILGPLITKMLYKSYDDTYYYRKPAKTRLYRPAKKYHYDGEVYFLMDGGSYSATTFTMALAYDMGVGTFIGQQPGGANWGSFAATWNDFKLPNSNIAVHMPLFKLTHQLPNKRSKSFVLTPDYEVDYDLEDFLKRKDSLVDFTLDLIR